MLGRRREFLYSRLLSSSNPILWFLQKLDSLFGKNNREKTMQISQALIEKFQRIIVSGSAREFQSLSAEDRAEFERYKAALVKD